jgi:hypothetical protein
MNAISRQQRRHSGVQISRLLLEPTDEYSNGRRIWRLAEKFHIEIERVNRLGDFWLDVRVFEGFETDLASIPRWLWWLFPHDECAEAAVVHDWLYRHTDLDRQFCDSVFRLVMRLTGKPYLMRLSFYLGVRLGGWAARTRKGC